MTTGSPVRLDSLGRRSAAIFAHPGHELRIYGWLASTRPVVSILTDGSGAQGIPRLLESRRLLENVGATTGTVFGRFTDRDIYRVILDRDVATLRSVINELTCLLTEEKVESIVTDAAEGFNPVHDLCCVLAVIAAEKASEALSEPIPVFDFVLEAHPGSQPLQATSLHQCIRLDEDVLARKMAEAREYRGLGSEVDRALDRYGRDAFAIEILRPVEGLDAVLRKIPDPPAYEAHGERSVERGNYRTVLRLRDHFLPLIKALTVNYGITTESSNRRTH